MTACIMGENAGKWLAIAGAVFQFGLFSQPVWAAKAAPVDCVLATRASSPIFATLETLESHLPELNEVQAYCRATAGDALTCFYEFYRRQILGIQSLSDAWAQQFSDLAWVFQMIRSRVSEHLQSLKTDLGKLPVDRSFPEASLREFRRIVFGLTGEIKAASLIWDRTLQYNAKIGDSFIIENRVAAEQLLAHRGFDLRNLPRGLGVRPLKTLLDRFQARYTMPDGPKRDFELQCRRELGEQYVTLFNPDLFAHTATEKSWYSSQFGLNWSELIRRIQRLELGDFVLLGQEKPLAWLEIKSRQEFVTMEDLAPGDLKRKGRGSVLFGLLQLYEIRKLLGLENLVELEAYFPNGIATDAQAFLESRLGYRVISNSRTIRDQTPPASRLPRPGLAPRP